MRTNHEWTRIKNLRSECRTAGIAGGEPLLRMVTGLNAIWNRTMPNPARDQQAAPGNDPSRRFWPARSSVFTTPTN
jgi:hypothetical protein